MKNRRLESFQDLKFDLGSVPFLLLLSDIYICCAMLTGILALVGGMSSEIVIKSHAFSLIGYGVPPYIQT